MAYKSNEQIVASLMARLSLIDLTDEQIETWSQGAVDIPSVQLKLTQIGKELRDVEQVVAKLLKMVSE